MKYLDFINDNYDTLMSLFNAMEIGIWITDAETRVVMVNDKSLSQGGLARELLIGVKMQELIDDGYVLRESSCIKAKESGHKESIIQELGEGGYIMAISTPLYSNGELDLIVCIERDLTEIMQLRKDLRQKELELNDYFNNLSKTIDGTHSNSDSVVLYSSEMQKLRSLVDRIGLYDVIVLITGESGTGKEIIADMIQENSSRSNKPYVKINCAAIPESLIESELFGYEKGAFTGAVSEGKAGLFEIANGGTLFLDEIGELSLAMQSKLLRTIQEMEIRRVGGSKAIKIDVRIIAATNRNLYDEVKKGNFRSDLYYRLCVIPIHIPPLRHRKDDILPMALKFIEASNEKYGLCAKLNEGAIKALEKHSWPGNVRELKNLIERLVVSVRGGEIKRFHVYRALANESRYEFNDVNMQNMESLSLSEQVARFEREIIEEAIDVCGSYSAAARMLKVDKSTISRKIKSRKKGEKNEL